MAKKASKKKKNCNGTSSYNCGATCISAKYQCNKDGLTGQSITISNKMTSMVKSASSGGAAPKAKAVEHETIDPKDREGQRRIHGEVFDIGDEMKARKQLQEFGLADPQLSADMIAEYSMEESSSIRKFETGHPGFAPQFAIDEAEKGDSEILDGLKEQYKIKADAINDFIEKAPAVKARLFSGFGHKVPKRWGLDELEVGSDFKFPSITSFSTSKTVAEGFNGGGTMEIVNNKTAPSAVPFSELGHELEVLTNKTPSYKVIDIQEGLIPGTKKYILEEQ